MQWDRSNAHFLCTLAGHSIMDVCCRNAGVYLCIKAAQGSQHCSHQSISGEQVLSLTSVTFIFRYWWISMNLWLCSAARAEPLSKPTVPSIYMMMVLDPNELMHLMHHANASYGRLLLWMDPWHGHNYNVPPDIAANTLGGRIGFTIFLQGLVLAW